VSGWVILFHQPVKIIDKSVTCVLSIFKMLTYVDCLDWAHFLAHTTEDAAKFVDFINEWEPIALVILTTD
tara:strand:- start:3109 stop:3318 length:210 start_codon:yes stop_codon:yes gene_type:complete